MENFKKVVRIGMSKDWEDKLFSTYCKINFIDGNLSISGVEGPTPDGNAQGSCGQIIAHDWDFTEYAPGWDSDKVARFREVWERWHLNSMRAGCEHQREIDTTRKVEVVEYGLTSKAYKMRKDAIAAVAFHAQSDKPCRLTATEVALVFLDRSFMPVYSVPADGPLSGCYEVKKREQKAIGRVRPLEHPDGMLGKVCGVCGHRYGSSWLKVEVPEEVLTFLKGLPDTDRTPAWV